MKQRNSHKADGKYTVCGDPLENVIDRTVTSWVYALWEKSAAWDACMIVIGQWTPIVMLALIVISTFLPMDVTHQAQTSAILAIVSAVVARVVNEPISRWFSRPRPFELDAFLPLLNHDKGQAFPSNHATGAFALAVSMMHVPGFGQVLISLAILLCVSRVYNGLHHMTDVCIGALHGSLIALLVQLIWMM